MWVSIVHFQQANSTHSLQKWFYIFLPHRADAKVVIDPKETRTPQRVHFEIASTRRKDTVDCNKLDLLDVLFEAIANDLTDDLKLAFLLHLGHDMEKFSSLLNTLDPELVRSTKATQSNIASGEPNGCALV